MALIGWLIAQKEFWLSFIALITSLTLLWKGLRALVREVRALVSRVSYIQVCLAKYGPTLMKIAEAYRDDTGTTLIEAVKRIEVLSVDIKSDTHLTKKASDISIDVLQAGVGALQLDTRALAAAFQEFERKNEADIQTLTADIRQFVKEQRR